MVNKREKCRSVVPALVAAAARIELLLGGRDGSPSRTRSASGTQQIFAFVALTRAFDPADNS